MLEPARIAFLVPGDPVGKGRPHSQGCEDVHATKTVSYEGRVAYAGHQAMAGRALFAGAVAVGLHVFVPIPASWSKRKQVQALLGEVLPVSKPDIDNIEKAIYDALNGVCWHDDVQVVDVVKSKRYSRTPCVQVEIMPMSLPTLCP